MVHEDLGYFMHYRLHSRSASLIISAHGIQRTARWYNYFPLCCCWDGQAFIPHGTRFILLPEHGTAINDMGVGTVAESIVGESSTIFLRPSSHDDTVENYELAYFELDTDAELRKAVAAGYDVLTVNTRSWYSTGAITLNDAFKALNKKGYGYSKIFGYFCAVGIRGEGAELAPMNEGYAQLHEEKA